MLIIVINGLWIQTNRLTQKKIFNNPFSKNEVILLYMELCENKLCDLQQENKWELKNRTQIKTIRIPGKYSSNCSFSSAHLS